MNRDPDGFLETPDMDTMVNNVPYTVAGATGSRRDAKKMLKVRSCDVFTVPFPYFIFFFAPLAELGSKGSAKRNHLHQQSLERDTRTGLWVRLVPQVLKSREK